jgi:FAD/FMN-containing dehydrogenase/Fe-S oxidoreductase
VKKPITLSPCHLVSFTTVDEPQRQRIRDDLKGLLQGELLFDPLSRALYSTDASIFQVEPAGVVVPRDEADVRALVSYAAQHHIPLIARGAGSGLAGEALGRGLIVDLSRHFRAILEVGEDRVRVQPGVTCRELNARLATIGRRFASDPASAEQCTIGGMLATNASGSRALRYGYTRDHVASLRIVLDTGDAAAVGQESVSPPAEVSAGHLQDLLAAVGVLLEQNAALLERCRPRTPFNRCGYLLHDVLRDGRLDLPRLLVGSEGTLALFTEATLRTIPLPRGRAVALLCFPTLEGALHAAQLALPTGPTACELIDRRLLSLARGSEAADVAALVPAGAEAVLVIEYEADSPAEARASCESLASRLRGEAVALHAVTAEGPEELDRFWHLREVALPSLHGLRSGPRPVAFVEDVGVPTEELSRYLHRVQEILREQETTASFLIHAGTGQVHTRPFLDLSKSADVSKLSLLAEAIHSLALGLGGTVSSQHGTGLARTPWVARQVGPLYSVFRQLKAAFDPRGLFNPGKIVDPDPTMPVWPLRRPVSAELPIRLLRWQEGEINAEIASCNGCGQCRTTAPSQRMCPLFRAGGEEAATPRAKANLLRHLLDGGPERPPVSANEVRAVADLCINCRMCASECPARVNIPKLMLEAKAANVAEHGLDRKDWFLARSEGFARWASGLAILVNLGLQSRTVRWLLEKLFGLSRRRRLPRFVSRPFLRLARRRGWSRKRGNREQGTGNSKQGTASPRVAFFVDVFANYNDPLIAEAAVAVLRHNGLDVYVPRGQRGCGMAALAYGDVETAREAAQANLHVLAESAREGYPIICSEPTAALMLRHDYPDLIDDPDARLVAGQTVELTSFLWGLHQEGRLRTDFQPLDLELGHHVPCHLKALGQPPAGPDLLGLVPGVQVHTIDVSCSGMAGTFGLGADNYAASLAAGRPMLDELARPQVRYGSTECSACRMQMEDGTGKRTLHPVQYLALAYGLLPELARRLEEPIRDLVLR